MYKRIARPALLGLILTLAFGVSVVFAETGNPNARPGASSPDHSFTVMYDVDIPMRDGVITRANIWMPDGEGPWPTILITTPYGNYNLYAPVETYATYGYAVVYRDVRGVFTSEGMFEAPSGLEIYDQYDTIDWIAAQDWSNGKVAALGASQIGQTAMFAAATGHPNLVCAVPIITSENVWRDGWYYRGGAMELGFISSWHIGLTQAVAPRILEGEALTNAMDNLALLRMDRESYLEELPLINLEPSALSEDYNLFKLWVSHPEFDEYWILNSPSTYLSSFNTPVLHVGGWYDGFANGAFLGYENAKNNAYSKFARDNQYLLVGPWGHAGTQGTNSETLGDFTVDLNYWINEMILAFLDYWMNDLQQPLFDPDMHAMYSTYLGEESFWNYAEDWPLPNVQETAYYLNGGKSGSIDSLNDGVLSTGVSSAGTAPATYVYDPMDPIPTRGGNLLSVFAYGPDGLGDGGYQEQTPVDLRSLTFTSQPLSEDLEISGRVVAVLYASSDAVDTDFVVRLNDVAPDGTSLNVVDGIMRARFRDSAVNPTLLEPGQIYELEVDLWSQSWIFQEGHSLRVVVNSSSYPKWSRNMNVAEFPEQATEWVVANNTIYLDPEHPSHVILPVVPR